MAEVFGRRYELYIGRASIVDSHTGFEGEIPPTIANPNNVRSQLTGGFVDFRTISEQAIKIENPIHINAECKYKDAGGGAGTTTTTSKIMIYNLSEETLKKIKADQTVILKAGYETDADLPMTFVGSIEQFSSKTQGSDKVTTLVCKEAGTILKSARFIKQYPKKSIYGYIFDDIIKLFKDQGIALGYYSENIRTVSYLPEARAFSGKLHKVCSDLCDELGYKWHISRGKVFIYPIDEDQPRDFLVIKKENVIGSINIKSSATGTTTADPSARPEGIKFKVFLDGNIGLESYVRVAEGEYAGDWKISSVVHKCSWHGGDWCSEIEAETIKEKV